MASSQTSGTSVDDRMRDEIARLTATINQHKSGQASSSSSNTYNHGYNSGYHSGYGYRGRGRGRGGVVAGPHKQYVRPGLNNNEPSVSSKGKENVGTSAGTVEFSKGAEIGSGKENEEDVAGGRKEVIIGGVAFEASHRSLVRKDLAKSKDKAKKVRPPVTGAYIRSGPRGHRMPRSRMYKPKGRRGRNMTLDNTNRTYTQSVTFILITIRIVLGVLADTSAARGVYLWRSWFTNISPFFFCPVLFGELFRSKKVAIRKIDKPCSKFTKTGTCSRGLTCPYRHDPKKVAICWKFMQGDCPHNADSCNLSHDPTPERTPLCVHFLNRGRCTKEKCPFPHVNVGKKEGVCKDFAVLGYCVRGVSCDKNHVRECPEFEETGECRTRGCKLPHVIKANAKWVKRGRSTETDEQSAEENGSGGNGGDEALKTAENAQLGDEYISLIFNESESEEEEEEENGDDGDGDGDGDEGEDDEEMEVHG